MPTEIKQVSNADRGETVLHVSGEMFLEDAALLAKIGSDLRRDTHDLIVLDLADLDLLDSEAAHILRTLSKTEGFRIEGVEIFLQSVVDEAERRHN
jgi:anti-anti-sigma regulatory factor